jgi:acyl dehydratase
MNYLEDIRVGEVYEIGRHTFSAEEIKSFARRFDPQPFHVDEEAAKTSHFGALCASGWHTALAWMRLMVAYRRREVEAARARGEPVAGIGLALGFRELKWLKPVYVNDTIDYRSEVIETRVSRSRPGLGLMTIHSTGVNQSGETVISLLSTTFVERRPDATGD